MGRIREETKKDIKKRIQKGRVVVGSSLSKKILENDQGASSKRELGKNHTEILYNVDSIKAKARFKKLVHKVKLDAQVSEVSDDEGQEEVEMRVRGESWWG